MKSFLSESNSYNPGGPNWLQEFAASAIPVDLALANATWVQGQELLRLLSETALAHLGGHSQQYTTQEVKRVLDRYEAVARGGAWVAWGTTLTGQRGPVPVIKPAQPRTNGQGKPIKYETPAKAAALPLLPVIPEKYIQLIERRWGVTLPRDIPIWAALLACAEVSVAIVEGWKKALALIAQGVPAICIRGITQWHAKGSPLPYPEIAAFCQAGRTLYIAFDQDPPSKLRTVKDVTAQALKLGKACQQLGAHVKLCTWAEPAKGIDDYLFRFPESERWLITDILLEDAQFISAYKRRKDTAESLFYLSQVRQQQPYPPHPITGASLAELPLPKGGEILGVVAPVGTGKTTAMVQLAQQWKQKHLVVVLSPRNSLGQQIAQKINIPHIHNYLSDADLADAIKAYKGVALCPDSLHRLPRFLWKSENILLILDEANQIIRHTLTGDTLQGRWSSHNQLFADLITNSQAIIASEADLPHYALQFLQAVSGKSVKL